MKVSRHIPEAVKREVRQRCGFGCIFCGAPLFNYDHLIDFAEVKAHDPSNINLLCDNHHRQKTAGRLSREAISERAKEPVNLSADRSRSGWPLELLAKQFVFSAGGISFRQDVDRYWGFSALVIDHTHVVSATWPDGWLMLDMTLCDAWGRPILIVEAGELKISTKVADFDQRGQLIRVSAPEGGLETRIRVGDDHLTIESGLFVARRSAVRAGEGLSAVRMGEGLEFGNIFMPFGLKSKPQFISDGIHHQGGEIINAGEGGILWLRDDLEEPPPRGYART